MKDYKPAPYMVRALRELRGQSPEEAARSINYTHLSWRQWESGKAKMPPCAWLAYRLGGLELADELAGSDKLSVRQAITKVFDLPKLVLPSASAPEVQQMQRAAESVASAGAREPTAIVYWALNESGSYVYDADGKRVYTVAAWWGTSWYSALLASMKIGDKTHFPVYDDVQDWIDDPRERRAFADHFGFDYLEEV